MLYIGAIQVITATVLTSIVSIVSCASLPGNLVSAIRTLVLSSIVGVSCVRRPFRLGKVHGLNLIFRALQPCVLIYIGSEVCEQLVHTCTRDASSPSWRRLVFHAMSGLMIVSGFMRARRPLAQTDLPFLLTILALFVVAMLPPPAVILSGPLCASPTVSGSIERVVRALIFSLLYSVFVYAAAPPVQSSSEVVICVMRASAATIWVLGAHQMLLPLALVQGGGVIYVRIWGAEQQIDYESLPLMPAAVDGALDPESGLELAAPVSPSKGATADVAAAIVAEDELAMANGAGGGAADLIVPSFGSFGARGLVDIGASAGAVVSGGAGCVQRGANGFGNVDIAAVAARLETEEQ